MHLLAITYVQQNDEVSISIYANEICLAHLWMGWVNTGLVRIFLMRLFWIIFSDCNGKTTHFSSSILFSLCGELGDCENTGPFKTGRNIPRASGSDKLFRKSGDLGPAV